MRIAGTTSLLTNFLLSSSTSVASAVFGRNAELSFFCTSAVLPEGPLMTPAVSSQARTPSAGNSQRSFFTARGGEADGEVFSLTTVILSLHATICERLHKAQFVHFIGAR